MGLNISNFNALLKEEFTTERIARMTYKKNKLLGLLPKITKFGGTDVKVPLIYGDPQSVGPFSNAQAAKASTQTSSAAFTLTRKKKYGIVTIDGETIQASKGDEAAFLEAKTTEIDGIFNAVTRDLALDLYRDGSGTLGTIASGQGTVTVTLANPSEARNFEVGMYVNVVHSGAVIGGNTTPTKAQLTGVDTSAGTLTLGSNWTTAFSTCAVGDTIVRDGCSILTGLNACMEGLSSYVPLTTTGLSSAFYGVTRSVSPTRLAGVRYASSVGESIESVLIGLSNLIGAEGGTPDLAVMSFENTAKLQQALSAKKTYQTEPIKRAARMPNGEDSVDIGYAGFQVHGPDGDIDVIADNACPSDRMFMLQTDTWAVRSIGDAPGLLDLDGNGMLRESSSDGYEIRIGYYGNLQCSAPGWNGTAAIQ